MTSSNRIKAEKKQFFAFRLAISVLAIGIGLIIVEGGARYAWHAQYVSLLEGRTSSFDVVDRRRELIMPRPDTVVTVREHRDFLTARKKTGGLRALDVLIEELGLAPDDELVRINRHGFKGPEFELPKPASVFRILTVGDSCTWGPALESVGYPRIMERQLTGMTTWGSERVEVINAGVMGYNLRTVLRRLDDFVATDPDLVTIYIGWNGTIVRADPLRYPLLYRNFATFKILYHAVINRAGGSLNELAAPDLFYDPDEPLMRRLRRTNFAPDMHDLDDIVTAFRNSNPDVRVVIITLAGLFDERISPDSDSLAMAFPTSFTKNLYAWSVLTRRYNNFLRRFADDQGLPLIDFEDWALASLNPRSAYYSDPVHPNLDGYRRMGEFLASELDRMKLLPAGTTSGAAGEMASPGHHTVATTSGRPAAPRGTRTAYERR